jgi:hypothetical protein
MFGFWFVLGLLDRAPSSCAIADAPARTVVAAEPVAPREAVERGVTGEVVVRVTLDERSHLVAAAIVRSASPLLNESALMAARDSVFTTRMHDCRYVPGSYNFIVDYEVASRIRRIGG